MFFKRQTLEVKLVGPTLVAAFHKAHPPLIWTFDLERNHSFTLALQGEEGDWELGVTSPKGDFYSVTRFLVREDADEAFAKVQKTLMKRRISLLGRVLKFVIGFFASLVVLLVLLGLLFGASMSMIQSRVAETASLLHTIRPGLEQPKSTDIQPGIPLPADQVLKTPP